MQYPGQSNPQPAYIELDLEYKTLSADYSGEIGNAMPMAVYHNRVLRFSISQFISGGKINEILNDPKLLGLCEQVVANHIIVWDGNNNVGKLNINGQDAVQRIEWLLEQIEPDLSVLEAIWGREFKMKLTLEKLKNSTHVRTD